ncbi:hypothetical protein [Montanilutibacter psychrotolerans]|uniref:Uncharacterized protein n=1 Tax=Montanilutibacter psychrotolerans TaxID=1327343 RepID=A0A3M8SWL8_9GAMM|nr:hypothetical protein [Lysobacter psychrotolerans]RNF85085.1 hypothetical protein EER27_04685 [Lysobacter psychrotolerans]
MILWGWGERTVGFDVEEHQFCHNCEQDRVFNLRLKYEYGNFYHLFGWVISKQFQLACPSCSHGWILNTASAESLLGRNPIQFHQRNGWMVMMALALIFGVAVFVHRNAA